MKAIRIDQPNSMSLVDLPMPDPGEGEICIQVAASGICGTDVHIYRGEYMGAYPVIPGHEFSGVVTRVGDGVARWKTGDRVAVEPNISCGNCWHCLNNRQNFCENWQAVGVTRPGGMAQYVLAPESAAFGIGELEFACGAFVEPLSCVLHGVERAGVRMGDSVLVLGAGPIGCLLVQVARLQGASRIMVAERNPARLQNAIQVGADQGFGSLDEVPQGAFDVVMDATGVPVVMARSLNFARKGGTVLLFGVPPSGSRLDLDAFLIFQHGLKIVSSFTSVRNSYQAVALLQSGQVDVQSLISHRLPLSEFENGIHLIENGSDNVRKVLILPNL